MLKRFRDKWSDKYSYDENTYAGFKTKMTVRCNDCNTTFEITPEHHLKYNNGGCPECSKYKITKCSKCGKEIKVSRHFDLKISIKCDECIAEEKRIKAEEIKKKREEKELKLKLKEKRKQERIKKNINKKEKKYYCGTKELTEQYPDISKRHSPKFFNKLVLFGLDISKLYTEEFVNEYIKVKNLLYNEYIVNRLSPADIYEKYNCAGHFKRPESLIYTFKLMGFKTRSLSESIINGWLQNKFNTDDIPTTYFKSGWHKTWDGNDVFLRSSYEFDFAEELDKKKISYQVEFERILYFDSIKNQERLAIPDFYLPETNTIVEVKSSWTLDKQNMIDKRKAYLELGYNFKLLYEHQFVELDDIEETKKRA